MRKSVFKPVVAIGWTAVWLWLAPALVAAPTMTRHALAAPLPQAAKQLGPITSLLATNQLQLAISLPLRDAAGLKVFLENLQNPASPDYHQYLTPAQFTDKYGPSQQDYQTVIDFAASHGLQVTGLHPNRLVLDVAGSVADIEKTFQVKMRVYPHPTESRTFYAPDTQPTVDGSLPVSLLSVSGLDNYSLPQPASLHHVDTGTSGTTVSTGVTGVTGVTGASPQGGSAPNGSGQFFGKDFRLAYANGTTLTGAGQTVALLEFDGYYSNDIAAYESAASIAAVPLVNIPVNGGIATPGAGNDEVSLDIEMAVDMAPGLSKVYVYEAGPGTSWLTLLSRMANDNLSHQIGCSWYKPNGLADPAADQIFQQMAAEGQTFLSASGDYDAYNGLISFPDDDPYITMVGGTTLTTASRGGLRTAETVWNNGYQASSGQYLGTGGGVSTQYPIPTWQAGINSFGNNGGATFARNVPDVALTADNIYIKYGNGQNTVVVGTSCAAPLWAGFMALVNQKAAAAGLPPAGFINPAVYELANESTYNSNFFDITTGNNFNAVSPNLFSAVTNYDLCTGLGTPKGTNLINALVSPDPLAVVSNTGFKAVGTPAGTFNIAAQTFTITNVGTGALSWSIINTSLWLNASKTSGTLAVGGTDSVTILLNATASNLPPATYSATLSFSNVTSHVGHYRYFALTTVDPLQVLLPSPLLFAGPPGGPLTPGLQSIILTNPTASTLNWSLNNPSVWYTAAPLTGSLLPGSQAVVTISPTAAANNLGDGNYFTTFAITNLGSRYVQLVPSTLAVGIVQNGGFETGDFTGWTLIGNTHDGTNVYNAVVNTNSLNGGAGLNFVHTGNYGAFLGDTNLATLAQSVPTTPGQKYLLSFWLTSPQSGTGQQFFVDWNTNAGAANQIFFVTNPPVLAWTNLTFTVTATGTNTTLLFGAANPPDGFGLDDVVLKAISSPGLVSQPTNVTVLVGGTAQFAATVTGAVPLVYQWRKNDINLANNPQIAGVNTPTLTLTGVTVASAGNYSLVVTNAYGAVTSSEAALTVLDPPVITAPLTNETVQCGSDLTLAVNATGAAPLAYQWSLNGTPVAGATSSSFALLNVHQPNPLVSVTVTNQYGSLTNAIYLYVVDTLPPAINLNGPNPLYVELGSTYTEPGATASDACAGAVPVVVAGAVNASLAGTNLITYLADDGNGNTNSLVRQVIVQDTTPPTIVWSFTNLMLAAGSNCSVALPDVTGTNFILASDVSGAITIAQTPTNNTSLGLGTNWVVLTVTDASGNAAYVTNSVVVSDATPPWFALQPQGLTYSAGTSAGLSAAAVACTPVTYQWYFNNTALPGQTNFALNLPAVNSSNTGNYFVTASAAGGATTSSVVFLSVVLNNATLGLASSLNPAGYRSDVAFIAQISPTNATGTVQLLAGTNLFNPQSVAGAPWVTNDLNTLPRGTNLITVIYSGDANYSPATNTLWEIVTNHPPVAQTVQFTRTADQPLVIAVGDLATNWVDVDGDTLSLVAVGVSTNGVVLAETAGTLTYFSTNNVADQFYGTIADGFGGTNVQLINIVVTAPTNSLPNITGIVANSDGSFSLTLTGAPGLTYVLETSTDLGAATTWQPVATNVAELNPVWNFTDVQATNHSQQFYRLRLVQ